MIKKFLVPSASDQNSFVMIEANFNPTNAYIEVPIDAITKEHENPEWLILQDQEDSVTGIVKKIAVVDQELKTQILAQRAAEAAAKEAERLATQYQRDRKSAYPSLGDQLDAIYKKFALDDSTEYDAIAAQIAAVKAQFPKPE
jgi:hypothetical protein